MRFLFLCLIVSLSTSAQIATMNDDQFAAIKTKTLYVPMTDTVNDYAKEMIRAIRSSWSLSPISFIHPDDLKAQYAIGNFYVTLERTNFSHQNVREIKVGNQIRRSYSAPVNNDYFYLHFWVMDDNFKPGKSIDERNKITIARAEMYLKSIGTGDIVFSRPDFSSERLDKEFCNGLPGFIRNIFQTVNNSISNKIEIKLKKDMEKKPGLAALQKDTLYVPNYWYGEGGTMLPNEKDNSANGKYIRNMLEDYPYPIKLVRRDELSDMIMNATRPVYYFNYIQSSADKMISVVNGLTGEILFYNFNGKSYRPKGSDFKDLGKEVGS